MPTDRWKCYMIFPTIQYAAIRSLLLKEINFISWLTEFYPVLSAGDNKACINFSTWPCANIKNNLQILNFAFEHFLRWLQFQNVS